MINSSKKKSSKSLRGVSPGDSTAQFPESKDLVKTKGNSYWYPLIYGSVCLAMLSALISYISKISTVSVALPVSRNWREDDEFYRSSGSDIIKCDFPIILAKTFKKKKLKNMDNLLDSPFIIRGVMTGWPANERWTRSNFSSIYGDREIKVGSESSIVYAGGTAASKSKLNAVLEEMSVHGNKCVGITCVKTNAAERIYGSNDSFAFDVSILRSIPEMGRDFRVPGTGLLSSPLFTSFYFC